MPSTRKTVLPTETGAQDGKDRLLWLDRKGQSTVHSQVQVGMPFPSSDLFPHLYNGSSGQHAPSWMSHVDAQRAEEALGEVLCSLDLCWEHPARAEPLPRGPLTALGTHHREALVSQLTDWSLSFSILQISGKLSSSLPRASLRNILFNPYGISKFLKRRVLGEAT